MTHDYSKKLRRVISENRLICWFVSLHLIFAVFLGRLYAFAPDEAGYLATFRDLYGSNADTNPQSYSGWIAAPKIFLWIIYSPAKLLNLVGVSDVLSIRILSIVLSALTLYLLLKLQKEGNFGTKISRKFVFFVFFIPSIFLWNSIGLRESFIFAEICLFLFGINRIMIGKEKLGYIYLFLGSYGLLSTKSYLWAILMIAVILSCFIYLFLKVKHRKIIVLLLIGLVLPSLAFASTTSIYALSYIFQSDISDTGERSGDSVSQVYVDVSESGSEPDIQLITFHGGSTLISLHFYLENNPDTILSKLLGKLSLDKKIQSMWDEKIRAELISQDVKASQDSSSLNGHVLKPGNIKEPLTMIWPALEFLGGPFPFFDNAGIAITIASLESPLWWAIYLVLISQFLRFRRLKPIRDPQIVLILVFLFGFVAASALVEVNLGTSFRHRSVLLVPLVFLYVRLGQLGVGKQPSKLD